MRKILSPVLAILFFASFAFGQTSECPTINVFGPAGIPDPSENIRYEVKIEPAEKAVGLSYLWKVSTINGEVGMVRGQGTIQIEVPFSYDYNNVTAQVTVIGLPEGCPSIGSESMSVHLPIVAIKLNEITGSLTKAPDSLFVSVCEQMTERPNALLFISVGTGKGGTVTSKTSTLNKRFTLKPNRLDGRFKIVSSGRKDDIVSFWLVPPGGAYPVL